MEHVICPESVGREGWTHSLKSSALGEVEFQGVNLSGSGASLMSAL